MMSSDARNSLEKLHARLVDTANGYREALDRTEDPVLRGFVQDIATLRQHHIDELARELAAEGVEPQRDGGWMTVVHESIMKVRDVFGTLDASARDEILKGEKTILDLYGDTIGELAEDTRLTNTVTRQRDELRQGIAQEEKRV